jgi:hypothetical protein
MILGVRACVSRPGITSRTGQSHRTTEPWVAVWGIAAAIGIAILRYRLYAIDRIVNRTLVYGLLTAVLGSVYAALVLVLGQLFGGIGGQPPSWVVVGATLAVAALFQPARRRIQAVVDRRFNRRSTMRPRPWRPSAPVCGTRSTWTPSEPSCWRWPTRRCNQRWRPCGCDPRHRPGRIANDRKAEPVQRDLTPCMPYTDLQPYHGRLQLTSCRFGVRGAPWLTAVDRCLAAPRRPQGLF